MNPTRRTLIAIVVALVAVLVLLQVSAKRQKKHDDQDADDERVSSRHYGHGHGHGHWPEPTKTSPPTTTIAPTEEPFDGTEEPTDVDPPYKGVPTLPPAHLWTQNMWECYHKTKKINKCVAEERIRQKKEGWPQQNRRKAIHDDDDADL